MPGPCAAAVRFIALGGAFRRQPGDRPANGQCSLRRAENPAHPAALVASQTTI
jgi:hypothetical protein